MNGMAGHKKILIVDDQEINRIILKNILVRESFEILEVTAQMRLNSSLYTVRR